jgi:hypothetical protein
VKEEGSETFARALNDAMDRMEESQAIYSSEIREEETDARRGGRPERTVPSLGGNRNTSLSQCCAKVIAFGTSWNKGEDFQGVSVLRVRDPSGYSKQMQMMRLVPDTTGCQHDLESEAEMLQIEGKLVLHCPKCDYYVFKGTDSAGFLTGLDQIGKMFDS